jgi:hypothetical protein
MICFLYSEHVEGNEWLFNLTAHHPVCLSLPLGRKDGSFRTAVVTCSVLMIVYCAEISFVFYLSCLDRTV